MNLTRNRAALMALTLSFSLRGQMIAVGVPEAEAKNSAAGRESSRSRRKRKSGNSLCARLVLSSKAPHADGDPRFGMYNLLTDGSVGDSGTPVYSNENGAGWFVYRTEDKWIVGTQLNSSTQAGLFAMDTAPTPEKTKEVWFALFAKSWSADPTLQVSCTSKKGKSMAAKDLITASSFPGEELCRSGGSLQEASACLRAAINKEANFGYRITLELRLANVLYRLNDPGDIKGNPKRLEEAAALYQKGIAFMPEYADIRQQHGSLLLLSNRLSEGEEALREALRVEPMHGSAFEDLSRVLQWQDRNKEAQTIREKAVELGLFPAVDFRPGTFSKDLPQEPIWTSMPSATPTNTPLYKSYPCLKRFVTLLRDNAPAIKREFLQWKANAPRDYRLDKFGYADPRIRGGEWKEWYIWPSDPFLNDFHSANQMPTAVRKIGSECSTRTPKTCRILRDIGVKDWDSSGQATMYEAMTNPLSINVMNARFSVVGPRGHLRPHVGPSNAKLSLHLPIVVPANDTGGHGSYLRVKDFKQPFIEGEPVIFDDTFEHEVFNYADRGRVTLWIFFSNPELTACRTNKPEIDGEL